MSPATLLALGGVGLIVGFFSGLIGIGGGVLIVPFLYFFYGRPALSGVTMASDLLVTVAHATSLFVIVPTAVMGTFTYARARLVTWKVAVPVAAFSVVAAVIGATVAPSLPDALLSFAFGLFLIFNGIQLVGRKPQTDGHSLRTDWLVVAAVGIVVGLLSSILGVGGGIVAIPLLLYVVRVDVTHVAATSLAVVGLAALSGTLTYIVSGAGVAGRPAGSFGFVHIAAATPILVGSLIAVRWGAKANQRVNRVMLRRAFGAGFILLGLRFAWQYGLRLFGG